MKKTVVVIALVAMVGLFATSCVSPPAAHPPRHAAAPAPQHATDPISDFIREVRRGTPENAMLGIGTSNHSNRGLARTTAETRARAEIARQLDVIVRNMVTDYMAGSEAEPTALLSFQESITQALAQSRLLGAVIRDEINVRGEQVVVVMLSSSNVANEIMEANRAAAALLPHMAGSNLALDRLGEALTELNAADPVARNHD